MSASWSWKSSGDTAVVRKTDDGITPSSSGGGGGVSSINADTTAAQTITGGRNISVATSSGNTTFAPTSLNVVNSGFTTYDQYGNVQSINMLDGFTARTPYSGTLVMDGTWTHYNRWSGGVAGMIIQLQDPSLGYPTVSIKAGANFTFINTSSFPLTVNASNGALLVSIPALSQAEITCIDVTGNTPASWQYAVSISNQAYTGTGPTVLANNPTLSFPTVDVLQFSVQNININTGILVLTNTSPQKTQLSGSLATSTFTASISTTDMTVTALITGVPTLYSTIAGAGVTAARIYQTTSETYNGALGVYTVSVSQTVASTTITATNTAFIVQLPDVSTLSVGTQYEIINNTTANIIVTLSSGSLVAMIPGAGILGYARMILTTVTTTNTVQAWGVTLDASSATLVWATNNGALIAPVNYSYTLLMLTGSQPPGALAYLNKAANGVIGSTITVQNASASTMTIRNLAAGSSIGSVLTKTQFTFTLVIASPDNSSSYNGTQTVFNLNTTASVLAVASGGTGVTTSTGTTSVVLSNGPTLVAPLLGTPASGVLTNTTGLPLTTGVTGTLPIANGGTNLTALPTTTANSTYAAWDANGTMPMNKQLITGVASISGNTSYTLAQLPGIINTTGGTFNITIPNDSATNDGYSVIVNNKSTAVTIVSTSNFSAGTNSVYIYGAGGFWNIIPFTQANF